MVPENQQLSNKDTECGYFCWKGKFVQIFTSTKVYALLLGLIGFVHFAIGAYEVAIVTTIEKRFKIPSNRSGLIMSSSDIGSLLCLMFLTYIGSKGHKPRWVAAGTFIIAVSSALWCLPHFIYGPGTMGNSTYAAFGGDRRQRLHSHCLRRELSIKTGLKMALIESVCRGQCKCNQSGRSPPEAITLMLKIQKSKCELGVLSEEVCTEGQDSRKLSIILLIANTMMGAGICIYYTLGISYLDDNTRKNKMPILLASSMAVRMFGPTFGFMVGSYALSLYIDPATDPQIKSDDPRWIGAWWIGFVPIGVLSMFLSFFMWPFPRHLPRAFNRKIKAGVKFDDSEMSFKDFRLMIARIFNNKVLIYNSISSTLNMFGLMGYWTFMPKYLESQFQQSASQASFVSGSVGLICTGLGTLSSSFVISFFRPKPRTIALWNVIVETIDVIGHFSYAFLGCPADNLQGHWENNKWNLTENCNSFCSCPSTITYTPLCSQDGNALFYSPCHAGCPQGSYNTTLKLYQNCSCMPVMPLIPGHCPLQCSAKFNVFLVVLCLMRFFSASGRAGNVLIQFRSVSEGDKVVSIAFTEVLLSAFAFIPAPIIYGLLLDQACMVWGTICGEKGHCWLYDGQTVRYYINFTASAFLLFGTLADIYVWKYSENLEIYDKEEILPQELQPLD